MGSRNRPRCASPGSSVSDEAQRPDCPARRAAPTEVRLVGPTAPFVSGHDRRALPRCDVGVARWLRSPADALRRCGREARALRCDATRETGSRGCRSPAVEPADRLRWGRENPRRPLREPGRGLVRLVCKVDRPSRLWNGPVFQRPLFGRPEPVLRTIPPVEPAGIEPATSCLQRVSDPDQVTVPYRFGP